MKNFVYVFLVLVLSSCSQSDSNNPVISSNDVSTTTILTEELPSQDIVSDREVLDAVDIDMIVPSSTDEVVPIVKNINHQALPVAGPSSPLVLLVLSISLYMFYRYKKA